MPDDAAAIRQIEFNDLEVPIHFALGDVTLPLRKLETIQPGFVFELQRDPANAVTISINGAVIGRGEMVLVEGRLAVHFTEAADHGT